MNDNEFSKFRFADNNKCGIPEFNKYLLDINEDGTTYKGYSSLYCEAKKWKLGKGIFWIIMRKDLPVFYFIF